MAANVQISDNIEILGLHNCIVEFQAFRGNRNEYIIKELVVLDLNVGAVYYFLFKPPFPQSKLTRKSAITNKWLRKHYHFINWNEGFVNYNELDNIMYHFCEKYKTIYTTGNEKRKWIQKYTTHPVVDCLVSRNIKDYYINPICCGTKDDRHRSSNCALSKAYLVSSFFTNINTDDTDKMCTLQSSNGSGGEKDYKMTEDTVTYHEWYANRKQEQTE